MVLKIAETGIRAISTVIPRCRTACSHRSSLLSFTRTTDIISCVFRSSSLEIFNFNTVQESNTGYDVTYWDRMLRMGKKINAFASDDNHNEGLFEDSCGGWICVQSPELSHDGIVQNFIDGNYYSSSGPEIYDWGVRDGKVWIDTSNVNHVNFVCGNIINDGTTVLGERFKDTLNHAEYALKGHETYIRVEAVDKYGRTAWTNPIYLEW